MEYKNFIDNLSLNNSNYNNPEQAITTANLCDTISRDINTDSQRFIYELLQNADDASNQNGILDFCVDFVRDFVIVSHKGEPFSKIDIESISSAGDGTKTGDINKTGFKGIGFKSVFSHSNFVIIKSGNFCFKFDKLHWANHWNNAWGFESTWKTERKAKNKDENLKMPWQILPIWTELPNELKNLSIFQEYSVSTIIRYDKVEELKKALNDLFSKSQIVLFLRSKKVKVSINTDEKIVIEKNISGEITILKRNGNTLNEWLIKTEKFLIPPDIQLAINADDKSPKKLKEAEQTEISFAIQVEKGKLEAVEKESSLIFTYLPTSINYGFPFLVNAGFLTDAGRQHLHQDTIWNNWLFKQIPIKFFSWVAELAHKNSGYNRQFLVILPDKLGGSLLESSFNEGFKIALQTIAFIPNIEGSLLKVKEGLFDKTNISSFINPQTLINFINKSRNKNFLVSSFVPYIEPLSKLSRLGIEMFDIDDLEDFFASSIFTKEHKLNENYNLISFLHEQAQISKGDDSRNVWNEILRQTPFIFDENEQLKKPIQIYFPGVIFSNEYSDKLSIIHKSTVSKINTNLSIKSWLESLGIKEPSDLSFIEKTIIEEGDTFVTKDNAIEIGRYLFNAHKKGVLQEEHYESLNNLNILTKKGNLSSAIKCFISDFYEPDLKIEGVYDNDIFVAEQYFENKDLKSEWKTFFIKIGVKNQLTWERFYISKNESESRRDYEYFKSIIELMDGKSIYANPGYRFVLKGFTLFHFSFIDYVNDHSFAKIFWSNVLKFELNSKSRDIVNGLSGWWNISHDIRQTTNQLNYFDWTIEHLALFPVKTGELKKAKEVLINSPENIELAGRYLSVLDLDVIIPENWINLLPFKKVVDLDDLLNILENIWKEGDSDKKIQKEKQKIISEVYHKLNTNYLGYFEKFATWGKNNKLLSQNGIDYYYPKELSVVTVPGFKASNLAFTKEQSPEIIELLRLFGVHIVEKINSTIAHSKVDPALKDKLNQILPLLALVSVDKSISRKGWNKEFARIKQKVSTIQFFEATEILLSYGDEKDKQKRSSWADEDNFYYVGKWNSPRVLDGLVEPLGIFLKIRNAERILTVLLMETFKGGLEYLTEKGFDISVIPDKYLNPPQPPNGNGPTKPGSPGNTVVVPEAPPPKDSFLKTWAGKSRKEFNFSWLLAALEWEYEESKASLTQKEKLVFKFLHTHQDKKLSLNEVDTDEIPINLSYLKELSSNKMYIEILTPNRAKQRIENFVILESTDNSILIEVLDPIFPVIHTLSSAALILPKDNFLLRELLEFWKNTGFEDSVSLTLIEWLREKFNPSDLEFIFGPPGTGKTTELAQTIISHLEYAKRIIILTPTNRAADVLFLRIHEALGKSTDCSALVQRFDRDNKRNLLDGGDAVVVVSTIHRFVMNSFSDGTSLRGIQWDLCAIDEASMIALPYFFVPLVAASQAKFIVAGDPFQLLPIGETPSLGDQLEFDEKVISPLSGFATENIYTLLKIDRFEPGTTELDHSIRLLTHNYRSLPSIVHLFSRFQYRDSKDSEILTCESTSDTRQIRLKGNLLPIILQVDFPVRLPLSHYEPQLTDILLYGFGAYHIQSAILSISLAKQLLDENPGITISILSPYALQVKLCEALLKPDRKKYGNRLFVSSVHRSQGEETDVTIVLLNPASRKKTDDGRMIASKISHFNNPNLLNVAISRPKCQLIILKPTDVFVRSKNAGYTLEDEVLSRATNLDMETWDANTLEEKLFGSTYSIKDSTYLQKIHSFDVFSMDQIESERFDRIFLIGKRNVQLILPRR